MGDNTSFVLLAGNLSPEQLLELDGKLFQVHNMIVEKGTEARVRLYPVSLVVDDRCPIIVGGERCGLKTGHEGKHMWAGGD